MSKVKRAAGGGGFAPPIMAGSSILGTLRATEMMDSKAILPAEILVSILDYLPVVDLIHFARTSRRMREMVYDDTRWVARLKSMGCWDETEARHRFEEAMKRRRETQEKAAAAAGAAAGQQVGAGRRGQTSTTLFDASVEEERNRQQQQLAQQRQELAAVQNGFETMHVSGTAQPLPPTASAAKDPFQDPEALLQVIKNSKSVRGHAREEYAKIYGSLAPFYFDLVRARSHADPIVFQVFRDPERQAQMLANLHVFAKSDWASGWRQREEKLLYMTSVFEAAVLREFEQGYEFWDVDGRMKRYASVLYVLNGGIAGLELFIQKHPLFSDREVPANPMDCVNQAPADDISLEPSSRFFEVLAGKVNEQSGIIERIFPKPGEVFWTFVDKVREEIIMEYVTPLFDETHERSISSYLKGVSGIFEQTLQFFRSLQPPKGDPENLEDKAKEMTLKIFEPHLDLYLQDELDYFTNHAETQVGTFEKKLSEQDATVESFYLANFNRQADKKDFLTSFKKVVMMPVTVIPNALGNLPQAIGSPFGVVSKSSASTANGSNTRGVSPMPSRPETPSLAPPSAAASTLERTGSPLPEKAPTDELAAKAALMASRLEGIKSLFSIEIALNLTHAAQASIGRSAVFIRLGGQAGGEAREQCESTFIVLLRILGNRHIKPGFERAVDHLSHYNPREVSDHEKSTVTPLVKFIELVNVGDLISQMVDVFYEQQLAGPKIADRNDFLDPAGLAKKKFEQMLDESVAAGLNKGIDVLMDEVEFIFATTQQPSDYNPVAAGADANAGANGTSANGAGGGGGPQNASADVFDIGPTQTATRVVELVSSHTGMLVGSTDKSMLDVFNGEVGLRLFTAVCKHLKRQRVSTEGAVRLISDTTLYFEYVRRLRNQDLLAYFRALRELSQIYLIDPRHAKEMATVIADTDRFGGVFRAEEVYEYAQRRADWYQVKRDVERAMYGLECSIM